VADMAWASGLWIFAGTMSDWMRKSVKRPLSVTGFDIGHSHQGSYRRANYSIS